MILVWVTSNRFGSAPLHMAKGDGRKGKTCVTKGQRSPRETPLAMCEVRGLQPPSIRSCLLGFYGQLFGAVA